MKRRRGLLKWDRVRSAAVNHTEALVTRWLPDGRREGREWVARNPTRGDARPGSFKVNLNTGAWGDFATDSKGGDLISLAAYLRNISQLEAARNIAEMLGIDAYE